MDQFLQFARRRGAHGRRSLATLVLALAALAALAAGPVQADFLGHGGIVRALAVSPDGQRLLSGGFDYTVRLWEFGTQTEERVLLAHEAPVNAVAFISGGQQAVTGGADGRLILWDLATGDVLHSVNAHANQVIAIAVAPDGRSLVTSGWDQTVAFWDLPTLHEQRRWDLEVNFDALAFGTDGTLATGVRDGRVLVHDLASGTVVDELIGHGMPVTSLVAIDERRYVSAALDGTLWLWDRAAGRAVRHFNGHDGPVYRLALADDRRTLLSVGRDGNLREWEVASGRLRRELHAHDGPAWSLGVTPDGRFAVTAGSDASLRVWHRASGERIGIPVDDRTRPTPWLESKHPGARMFRKCAACHALGPDEPKRSGPHLAGLFGRRAGSLKGYRYSAALDSSRLVWNAETLHELFSRGPDVYLPGTKMPVQRIPDPESLAALIAYLEELTAPRRAGHGAR